MSERSSWHSTTDLLPSSLPLLPSTIQGDLQHGLPIAYKNPAFDQTTTSDLADLSEALRATVPSQRGQWHGVWLDGKRWQLRVSGEYCTAIAQGQGNKTWAEGGDSVASGHTDKSPFDWIGEEPANVSPWIKFVRDFDWALTPVGPMQQWPPLLKMYVLSIMANPNPRLIVWGKEMTFIYNEPCVPLWGAKHPDALGKSVKGIFAEAWDNIGCVIENAYAGITTRIDEFELPIQCQGFLEELYWNFTLLPVYEELGKVVGTYDELTESTTAVVSERRRGEINDVSKSLRSAPTLPDLWPAVLGSIRSAEVPFALVYAVVDDVPEKSKPSESNSSGSSSTVHPKKCLLYGSVGISDDYQDKVDPFPLNEQNDYNDSIVQACLKAWKTKRNVALSSQDDTLPASLISAVATSRFGTPVRMGIASPINSISGTDVLAYGVWDESAVALAQQLRMTTLKAEKSEAKLARLAGAAPTGMFMFDVSGRALYVNDTYLEMLGMTREEHAQKPDVVDKRITSYYQASTDKKSGQEISDETWLLASYQKPTGKHHSITFIPARHSRPARTPRSELENGPDIYLQMAVYDTGKGLNEDEMKVLFPRFEQAGPKISIYLEMPTMNGLTCIRHIRERQNNGKIVSHVPVIAVTANARSEQISTAIEAGMDRVVTKPFRIPELVPQMHGLAAEFSAVEADGG
ncbi:histidine kinase [Pseudocercospora fijiensis CIRAD86]|uniref:Histidine kinase n=1 Tax=Pseudocercospora fijiensis (strain CIRAD86) TaxID=383855 RepID=M3AP00_PSEFD|nr:histidine kinase [Pseudocercospora fijiensis CIRAD86]EME78838.1 histidine kinase [Pseudocercospora fijiensis CIRAD86]